MNFDPRQSWAEYVASMSRSWSGQGPTAGPFGAAPFGSSFEGFASAAQSYLGVASGAAAQADAARRFGDALREVFANFPLQWGASSATGLPHGPGNNPFEQPALGIAREHQQRWQRMAEAMAKMDAAQRTLQVLWSDAMREAAGSFTASLGTQQPPDNGADATRKLYDRWIDCAENAYGRVVHGEAFCVALAEFINAGSQWREAMQASLEHAAAALDLPTRSEINTLTRRIAELERALRKAPP